MSNERRSTLMLKKALELAGEHDVVPILVPNFNIGHTLSDMAWNLLGEYEDGPDRHKRLKFVPNGQHTHLAGFPETPVLADHTWHDSVAWVLEAQRRLEATEGRGGTRVDRWRRSLAEGAPVRWKNDLYTVHTLEHIGYGKYAKLLRADGSKVNDRVCVVHLEPPE